MNIYLTTCVVSALLLTVLIVVAKLLSHYKQSVITEPSKVLWQPSPPPAAENQTFIANGLLYYWLHEQIEQEQKISYLDDAFSHLDERHNPLFSHKLNNYYNDEY